MHGVSSNAARQWKYVRLNLVHLCCSKYWYKPTTMRKARTWHDFIYSLECWDETYVAWGASLVKTLNQKDKLTMTLTVHIYRNNSNTSVYHALMIAVLEKLLSTLTDSSQQLIAFMFFHPLNIKQRTITWKYFQNLCDIRGLGVSISLKFPVVIVLPVLIQWFITLTKWTFDSLFCRPVNRYDRLLVGDIYIVELEWIIAVWK